MNEKMVDKQFIFKNKLTHCITFQSVVLSQEIIWNKTCILAYLLKVYV